MVLNLCAETGGGRVTNVTDQTDSGTGVAATRSVAHETAYRSTPEALAEVRAEVRKIS